MITTVIALFSVLTYLGAGLFTARIMLPEFWRKSRDSWSYESSARMEVMWKVVGTVCAGLFSLIALGFVKVLSTFVDRGDPRLIEERLKQERIAALRAEQEARWEERLARSRTVALELENEKLRARLMNDFGIDTSAYGDNS